MEPKRKSPRALPALSNAEWAVMQVFWNHGPMAARDVVRALSSERAWAYRTVTTLLSRMVDKGALEYDRVGNSHLYRPAVSRDRLTRNEVKGFVDRVLDGSLTPLVAGFIEAANLSEDEIRQLAAMLEQKRTEAKPAPEEREQ